MICDGCKATAVHQCYRNGCTCMDCNQCSLTAGVRAASEDGKTGELRFRCSRATCDGYEWIGGPGTTICPRCGAATAVLEPMAHLLARLNGDLDRLRAENAALESEVARLREQVAARNVSLERISRAAKEWLAFADASEHRGQVSKPKIYIHESAELELMYALRAAIEGKP